jgi:hypothetical protein
VSRRRRTKRPVSGGANRAAPGFWGHSDDATPEALHENKVRLPADPTALLRSLGEPPLGPNPAAAQHNLAVVYDEAVRAAIALAAANGLLEMPEDPEDG